MSIGAHGAPAPSAPTTPAPTSGVLRLALHAMGTRFEIALVGDPTPALRATGEAALDEVRLLHDRLSRFQPDSLLSRINREAAVRPVRIDPETFELLSRCAHISAASRAAFDPTVGACMDGAPAAPCGFDAVLLDPAATAVRFSRPLTLDLGAIAKGYALDRAADILREFRVAAAFLHAGTSSALAIGAPPDNPRGWRIRIRSDAEPIDIFLRDAALGVSAPRGRTIAHASGPAGHILNPRTGLPALAADTAAVIGPSAAECDAWSTALIVLGARPPAMPHRLASRIHDASGWRIDDPRAPRAPQPHTATEAA